VLPADPPRDDELPPGLGAADRADATDGRPADDRATVPATSEPGTTATDDPATDAPATTDREDTP
jgi:hypothetical protein